MTSARGIQTLWAALCSLRDPLIALSVAIQEDQPPGDDDLVLVEHLDNATTDVRGWLENMLGFAGRARLSDERFGSLTRITELWDRLERRFWSDIASYERLSEVVDLGRERPEWSGWTGSIERWVNDSAAAVHDVRTSLLTSWQDLAAETHQVHRKG
jgi:hypothetical protein